MKRTGINRLSERERQVLALVREGKGLSEIATELAIRPKTAERHKQHLMEKLNLHRVSQLLAISIVAVAAFGQRTPPRTPARPPFEFNVEKCQGDICMTAMQAPGDSPDQFRVVVKAMKLADRALVTVLWETNPTGLPQMHAAQAITDKTPTIVDQVPAVAEFRGVPRVAVLTIRVALVKVEETQRQEFRP